MERDLGSRNAGSERSRPSGGRCRGRQPSALVPGEGRRGTGRLRNRAWAEGSAPSRREELSSGKK